MSNFSQATTPVRLGGIASLFAIIGVVGGAAFGLGVLWAIVYLSHTLPLINEIGLIALTLVLLCATVWMVRGVMEHLSSRHETEIRLQMAESRFKATFEQFPLSIQVVRLDGYTRSVNRAWEKLFGATLDDIGHVSLLTDPAIRESGAIVALEAALAGHLVVTPPILYNMLESWPFSSHGPDVQLWIKATICPMKDGAGRVTELILIHEDVTEQTLAQQARYESEARKSAIVETALDCIISIDDEGYIIEWNPSGYHPAKESIKIFLKGLWSY